MKTHDFQRFYYSKIALGEGCGCSEGVIQVRENDAQSNQSIRGAPINRLPTLASLMRRLLGRLH